MASYRKILNGAPGLSEETPLEASARSITEFRQALSELATAAEQSTDPSLHAMPYDRILAYISRLATILQDLAAEPDAVAVLSDLNELRIDMSETVRALHRTGLH